MKVRNKALYNKNFQMHYRTIGDDKGEAILVKERFFKYNDIDVTMMTPSKARPNYSYMWCRHRIGKPARILQLDRSMAWYLMGDRYYYTREYCAACGFSDIKTMLWILKYGEELPSDIDLYPELV